MHLYCIQLINLIDNKLLNKTNDHETLIFYYKVKAHYYEYLSEITSEQQQKMFMNHAN